MATLIFIFFVMWIHWVGDFVLQTHWQAMNKSTSGRALVAHVLTYTLFWFCIWMVLGGLLGVLGTEVILKIILFCCITFVCHMITDYFTSRATKKLFAKQDYHNGFVVVGLDQLLHYLQLYTTLYLLLKY